METMGRWLWSSGLACVLAAGAVACGDASEAGATGDDACPRGQVLDGDECVSAGGSGRGGGGGGTGTDAGGVGDATPDVVACTPGDVVCLDIETVGTCNATGDGYDPTPCDAGLTCDEGVCLLGPTGCEPGEVLRCATPSALLVCADNGVDETERPCPTDQPNCIGGECTDRICEPGARSCQGDNVVECDEAGQAQSVVETCETACSGGVCIDPCLGDGKTYTGCSFFAVDLDNYAVPCSGSFDCDLGESCVAGSCEPSAASQQFAVTVSNSSDSDVDVTVFQGGSATEITTVRIGAGGLQVIDTLPRRDVDDSSRSSNSFRLESTGPITVHQFNPNNNEANVFSNDASLLLPSTSLGTEYIVTSWPTQSFDVTFAAKGAVTVVAVTPGETTVNVLSPVATLPGVGNEPPALAPGTPQTFTLSYGEVISFAAGNNGGDLTGFEVESNQPVAVFSGHECANVPTDVAYCDHIEQQLFPVDTWGTSFVGPRFAPRGTEADVWRIVASTDGTLVRLSPTDAAPGIDGRTLNRGEFVEFRSQRDFIVEATAPVSAAQFIVGSSYPADGTGTCTRGLFGDTNCAIRGNLCDSGSGIGDPAFLLNVPVSQYRTDYIVLTPDAYQQDYLTVVAPSGSTVSLDGSPLRSPAATVGTWDIYREAVVDGTHRITADEPVGLFAYGYDCDVSYAYPGGLNLDSLR